MKRHPGPAGLDEVRGRHSVDTHSPLAYVDVENPHSDLDRSGSYCHGSRMTIRLSALILLAFIVVLAPYPH
jgi:hypothetical protein